ncbi:MAG TPA: efflux RND transporter periplasmic adaptor subunit [Thermoanaerobaculia bacterium]|nr:efflux RND transporter periplasmic adaptor subunit [Thermoanaerobaculia bacterium]
MGRQWCSGLLLVAGLALAACGGGDPEAVAAGQRGGRGDRGGPGGAPKPESLPVREVRVAHATTETLARTVPVAGTLAADEQAQLGLKVAGRLESISVDLGDPVRRGQVIARLVPTDFQLRISQAQNLLDQARASLGIAPGTPNSVVPPEKTSVVKQAAATLNQARLTRDRMANLFEQQLIPRQDLDTAEANFGVAEARYQQAIEDARGRQAVLGQRMSELEIARQQLSDSMLKAPFDGMIQERLVSPGDYVAAGAPVVVLVRVHPLRLRLAVPERESANVRTGQEVRVTVEGDPETHAGRVARISPAISEENRTLQIEAEVPNPDARLRPGSFARAEIVTRSSEPAVVVPAAAIVRFAGLEKVMGVESGKAVEKRVRTGRRSGDRIEIVDGVAAGEPVVLNPGNLVGGQPVKVAP